MSGRRRSEAFRRALRAVGLAEERESATGTTSLGRILAQVRKRYGEDITAERLPFGGAVEACGAEGVAGPGGVGEAGGGDQFLHALGGREAADRVRQVRVGGEVAGDEAAEARQDVPEIEIVDRADETSGLVELEDGDLAAGPEDAVEFRET